MSIESDNFPSGSEFLRNSGAFLLAHRLKDTMSNLAAAPSPIPSPPAAVRSVASEDVVARKVSTPIQMPTP